MSAPKDKDGKDIKVGDYLAYISPNSSEYTSHMAKVTSIDADGTLSGTRLSSSGANLSTLDNDVIRPWQIERLQKARPTTSWGEPPAALLPAKEYIKYTPASGGTRTGRRRKTRKHKRVSRKTRRSRK
jgi:hypothetical protein